MDKISNLGFLKDFTGGDKAKMEKYINMFLKNIPGLLGKIDEHLAAKDWQNLKVSIHSIKPQLTFMGAKEASSFAQSIESDLSNNKDLDTVPERVASLKSTVQQLISELSGEAANL
ncbi:MAG: Hpt domain-containing protein [Bacteroidia bacterium]|nr:Hpt domain-containing protein [Bacteroidia bacterium]